jgi:hypothetical protein
MSTTCFCQSGSLTVYYSCPMTGCTLNVRMYASCSFGTCTPAACDQWVSNVFTMSTSGTLNWCTPLTFQDPSLCGATDIGWASTPCTNFTTVPSDFQWNGADFWYTGTCPTPSPCSFYYVGAGGSIQDGCMSGCPSAAPTHMGGAAPCPGGALSPTCMSALSNVSINIH